MIDFRTARGMPSPDRYEHGTRSRYVAAKCRCQLCRDANTAHRKVRVQAQKQGQFNGLVPTAPVRQHIVALQAQGVGLKRIADKAGVARSIPQLILNGKRTQIRNETALSLLGVTNSAKSDRFVPAGLTWMRIYCMVADGVPKTVIARRLGSRAKVSMLSLRHDIVATQSHIKVRRVWLAHEEECAATEPDVAEICTACGHSHAPAERQRLIARLFREGVEALTIMEAWPCFYPFDPSKKLGQTTSHRKLMRDLAVLRGGKKK